MKANNFVFIGVGSIVSIGILFVVISSGLGFDDDEEEGDAKNSSTQDPLSLFSESLELDFTYDIANHKLSGELESQGISMSSTIELKGQDDIAQYCKFFDDPQKQNQIRYCTSTELRDSGGEFLGNIHMGGSQKMPKIVIALIQTDTMMTQLDAVKTIFQTATETLVCYCWPDLKPDGFASIDGWVDAMQEFHKNGTTQQLHSKSKILNLEGKKLQAELTTNDQGFLWKLLIAS